jgi:Fur family transcriptional regulator, ferric uptake regulator
MTELRSSDIACRREEERRLRDHVEHAGGRFTRTRRLILEAICDTHSHFSGDDIFIRLSEQGYSVSRASIFRALPLLVRAGLLRESVSTERPRHYEHTWGHSHHEHLICSECERVTEFDDPDLEELLEQIASRHGYAISDHRVEILGTCQECRSER